MVHFSDLPHIHQLEDDGSGPLFVPQEHEDITMWLINMSHLHPVVVPEGELLDRVIEKSFWVLAYFALAPCWLRENLIKSPLSPWFEPEKDDIGMVVDKMSRNLVL